MKETIKGFSKWILFAALAFILFFGFGTQASAAVTPSAGAASISAYGYSAGVVRVKGTVPTKVKSKDSQYYLFEVNAGTDNLVRKISSVNKSSSFTFRLKTSKDPAYPLMKYALAVKTGNGTSASSYTRISPAVFVTKPEKAASVTTAYQYPKTKKGLQSASLSEQTSSGSKNCFFNLYVSEVTNGGTTPFYYDGVTYYFNELWHYRSLVSSCNSRGISVTMQIMLDGGAPSNLKAASGGVGLYAFNVQRRASRRKMDALFVYLGKLFASDDCYVSNWILGNEVNSSYAYWYMGNVTEDQFVENYSACFRSLYNAVRSSRASSRVFICLEHCWTMRNSYPVAFPGKSVLQKFNAALKRIQKGVEWNLAYHAYPLDLRVPSFWNDSVYSSADSPIISPKNLKYLTNYIRNTYGKNTRIIISEIGFNSYGQSQDTQAAALALAYDIAACDPMIDAFHVRSYYDDPGEAAQGLLFGIKGKKAFTVFKYMDTTSYLKKTQTVLNNAVGSKWKSYVPHYKASSIYGMYVG